MDILARFRYDSDFKKFFFCALPLVLIVLVVFYFFFIRSFGGPAFVFEGETFRPVRLSSNRVTLRDAEGEELLFAKGPAQALVVEYKDSRILYSIDVDVPAGVGYSFSDGTSAAQHSPLGELTEAQQREVRLIAALEDYAGGISPKHRYPYLYILLLLATLSLVVYAMYMVFYAEECYERGFLQRFLLHRGMSPDLVYTATKEGGSFLALITLIAFAALISR